MAEEDKLRNDIEDAKRSVKNAVRSRKGRDILTFLAFFAAVFCYWYLVNMGEEHESQFTFDVSLRHVPDEQIITAAPTPSVTVTLRDRGGRILEYRTRKSMRRLAIDCREYKPVDGRVVITGQTLQKLLDTTLSPTAEVLSISPDTIRYCMVSAQGRRLPVYVQGTVATDNYHVINRSFVTPDSVDVYAPKSVLDTMQGVWSNPVNLTAVTDSITTPLTFLRPSDGMLFEPDEALFSVVATPYVEKTLELPIRAHMFPYGVALKAFPSKAKVTFLVSMESFHDIDESCFELVVNYLDLDLRSTTPRAKLELLRQPEGIKSVVIVPEEVDYLFENNEL